MKITIESTSRIVEVNGQPARIWQGTTETGIPIAAFVSSIVVERSQDCRPFELELSEHAAPRVDLAVFPARLIIDYDEEP